MSTYDTELLRILYVHNPWWVNKPIPSIKLKEFKRRDYYKLLDQLEHEKIVAITGPRQVGKTTLMFQLIEKLLTETKPQNIFYLSLDDPYLKITPEKTKEIFELYSTVIIKKPIDDLKERVYFFLDEIQAVENWEEILKRWYDLGYKIKFVISGSSSLSILQGSSEALVGRLNPQIVLPMKFIEYLRFREGEKMVDLLNTANSVMRMALRHAITKNKPEHFYNEIVKVSKDLIPYKDKILVHLNQYFIKGGYPEIAATQDLSACAQYLRNYLQLTMYKDILRTNKVRDPVALENLFAILAKESSQIINRVQLAQTLDLRRETLNTYLHLLKTTFLISESEFYSQSRVKRSRREKKIYVNDVGIRNVSCALLDDQTLTNTEELGKIIETMVADHTKRLQFNLDPSRYSSLMYWREKNEVDIVIDLFGKPLPIEVKYREQIRSSDIEGVKNFQHRVESPLSIVVTKNHIILQGPIVFMPVWQYLIMC